MGDSIIYGTLTIRMEVSIPDMPTGKIQRFKRVIIHKQHNVTKEEAYAFYKQFGIVNNHLPISNGAIHAFWQSDVEVL